MCVDFTDLNKACPKHSFMLPRINFIVDSTAGHCTLSFMDAYSRYNQICIKPEDEEKTSFITDREQHLDDLREVFAILQQSQMKLNPAKCTFGVRWRTFLGFMVSEWGIEVNPEKVDVILCMAPP
ncbi:uncharacterized protein LOC118347697 [Juglans regia]|uniref:Uncharacterized protein LOC118347697 n=1 Tax=Juglans regia TaxID=51240 RepID=A0A6P9E681_JUGRE|nr:uncharacterized protein LOC118347697 [Juglans regia]